MKPSHIKKYIDLRKRELGLSRGDLGRRLGRPEKSLRRLDLYCLTLKESSEFILKLKSAIAADESLWNQILAQDLALLEWEALSEEQKERERFQPHLWMNGVRSIPSPIFVVCLFGENTFRKVLLPINIGSLPEQEQFQIAHQYFLKFSVETDGFAGPFGPIKSYYYRQTYEMAYEFDLNGKMIKERRGRFPKNKATMRVK